MAARRTISSEPPLVVIAGPTASGKTALGIRLAKEYGGEIICADSRTIYKEMDIGTAKPTKADQEVVPHWGIDLVAPGERFSVADFKRYAEAKITEVRARGHIPFLVGGTGLYIDAILFDYRFGGEADPIVRKKLESLTTRELHEYCINNNIALPENQKNKRYLIRAIEREGKEKQRRNTPISNSIIVGIATDKHRLDKQIEERAEQLFNDGVVNEAILLGKRYGWSSEAFTGNIYRIVKLFLDGRIGEAEMKSRFVILDRQLAKRQLTWLRRNPFVKWLDLKDAEEYLSKFLATNR